MGISGSPDIFQERMSDLMMHSFYLLICQTHLVENVKCCNISNFDDTSTDTNMSWHVEIFCWHYQIFSIAEMMVLTASKMKRYENPI